MGLKILFILLLTSCASQYRAPETLTEKIHRYKGHQKAFNTVPQTQILDINYQSLKRRPASTVETKKMVNYSHKSLYFLTLVSQYRKLRSFSQGPVPKVRHCPKFHTEFLSLKEDSPQKNKDLTFNFVLNDKNLLEDKSFQAKNPELLLPISPGFSSHTVAKTLLEEGLKNASQVIKKAVGLHESKILSELLELCEKGSSDNYYVYRNLVTYSKANPKKFKASNQTMKTLLKTTLFYNMVLIKSLKLKTKSTGRQMASIRKENHLDKQVHHRLNVNWMDDYLQAMSK